MSDEGLVFTQAAAIHAALNLRDPRLPVDAASLHRESVSWRDGELGEQVGHRVAIAPADRSFAVDVAEDCTAQLILWVGDEPVVAFPPRRWVKGCVASTSEFPIVLRWNPV